MSGKVMIEIDGQYEAVVRRALALAQEMEHLALTAPDGTVLAACEAAVLHQGRQLQTQMLQEAVARRIQAAEKRGRRSALAPAAGRRRTAGPNRGNS
jgi:hypothetical protein